MGLLWLFVHSFPPINHVPTHIGANAAAHTYIVLEAVSTHRTSLPGDTTRREKGEERRFRSDHRPSLRTALFAPAARALCCAYFELSGSAAARGDVASGAVVDMTSDCEG